MTNAHRRLGVFLAVVGLVICGGCITAQPTIDTTETSPNVFESISTTDAWGTSSIQASVTLAPSATTSEGVTSLSVVSENGSSFYTTTIDPGQTSVTLPVPTDMPATIVATNTVNGTTVDTANLTVSGRTIP